LGFFSIIVLVTVINQHSVSEVLPLHDFVYNNNLTLRQNFKVIIEKLKISDFFEAKPFHVISITKRRNYRVISDVWQKESLPEYLRKATLLIHIFADAPDVEEN
jgi:hypothetical protein